MAQWFVRYQISVILVLLMLAPVFYVFRVWLVLLDQQV
jgi:hypothetical protein